MISHISAIGYADIPTCLALSCLTSFAAAGKDSFKICSLGPNSIS